MPPKGSLINLLYFIELGTKINSLGPISLHPFNQTLCLLSCQFAFFHQRLKSSLATLASVSPLGPITVLLQYPKVPPSFPIAPSPSTLPAALLFSLIPPSRLVRPALTSFHPRWIRSEIHLDPCAFFVCQIFKAFCLVGPKP